MDEDHNQRIATRIFQAARVFVALGLIGVVFLGGVLQEWLYAGLLFGALGLLSLMFARTKAPSR